MKGWQWRDLNYGPGKTDEDYVNELEGNLQTLVKHVANAFAPYANDPADMTVFVAAGAVLAAGGPVVQAAAQQSAAIAAAVTNPRIDLMVIDGATGALEIVTGVEAATPVAPALPAGKLPDAEIAVSVGMTEITNDDITDRRIAFVVGGGEGSLDLDCTFDPNGVLGRSRNVDSVTDSGTGDWTVNVTDPFASAVFTVGLGLEVSAVPSLPAIYPKGEGQATDAIHVGSHDGSETRNDSRLVKYHVTAIGELA